MFTVNDDKSIYVTRGDVCFFAVSAEQDGVAYKFQPNDIVRIKVTSKKDAENVLMQKSFAVEEETDRVTIYLTGDDTKFGDVISKATDYWYEIELNPYTNPQTIIGFDEEGAKIFKLFPEGKDVEVVKAEDIPAVDKELDLTSERPVQNQAIARALIQYEERVEEAQDTINATADEAEQRVTEMAKAAKTIIEAAESEALTNVLNSSAAAEASAQRAKEEADRASSIASGDFATNGKVDDIIDGTITVGNADKLGGKEPSEYAAAGHGHSAQDVGAAEAEHNHKKSEIIDFPDSMPPTEHKHTKSEITDFPDSMPPAAHTQSADTIYAGTFKGQVKANATAQATLTTAQLRDAVFVAEASAPAVGSTADTSKYPEGCLIVVVEAVS